MSPFLFVLIFMIALDVGWLAVFFKLLKPTSIWRKFCILFIVFQSTALAWFILGRVYEFHWTLPGTILTSVYLWHLLFLPLLNIVGLLAIVVAAVMTITRRFSRGKINPPSEPAEPENTQTRRQFLLTAATVAPPLFNLALTGFSEIQIEQFRLTEKTLSLPDLPRSLSGMTIAHVSDLHVGPFTSDRVIRRVALEINSLKSDLVLFTGDLMNSKLTELPEGIDFIRSLEARFGVYLIEGNHDLFEGRSSFQQAVRLAGLHYLSNEAATLRIRDWPVQLLGLRWGGREEAPHSGSDSAIRESMRELLALREDDGTFPILLAHHPHAFDPAVAAGLPLTLSGHTHGGQLMLNPRQGFGPLMFRYWSGCYQRNLSQLFVSNGVGNWFPLRTAAPAEITQITLRRS